MFCVKISTIINLKKKLEKKAILAMQLHVLYLNIFDVIKKIK